MKRFLKWVAIVAGSWVLLIALLFGYEIGWMKLARAQEWKKARAELRETSEKLTTSGIADVDSKDSEYYANLIVTFHLDPVQRPKAREELVSHQLDLSPGLSTAIMGDWYNFAGDDFLPLVRKMVGSPYYDPNALRALAQLKPEEARSLFIQDLQRKNPRYIIGKSAASIADGPLLSLPRAPIPELEPFFRQQLTSRHPRDLDLLMASLERYGTPTLLPDLIKFYTPDASSWSCAPQSDALRFWISNDPKSGLEALKRALASRKNTRCYSMILSDVLVPEWTDDALPLVTKALDDPDPEVVASAVQVLREHADSKYLPDSITALQRVAALTGKNSPEFFPIRSSAQLLIQAKDSWRPNDVQRQQIEKIAEPQSKK